jgi:AcrR family transcriptional regulator
VKSQGERRIEILAAAGRLFTSKGYEKTTINDILEMVGIGKGTFYHYFSSKEELLDAIVSQMAEYVVAAARQIADNPQMPAMEKMRAIILLAHNTSSSDNSVIQELKKPANAQLHQKSVVQTLRGVAPVLAEVVRQGVTEGEFVTPFPLETVEFLLVANQFIFDEGIFDWTPAERITRARAFAGFMEITLGAATGSFDFIAEVLRK